MRCLTRGPRVACLTRTRSRRLQQTPIKTGTADDLAKLQTRRCASAAPGGCRILTPYRRKLLRQRRRVLRDRAHAVVQRYKQAQKRVLKKVRFCCE